MMTTDVTVWLSVRNALFLDTKKQKTGNVRGALTFLKRSALLFSSEFKFVKNFKQTTETTNI